MSGSTTHHSTSLTFVACHQGSVHPRLAQEEAEEVSVSDPTARRIARLAASAARAARMWRAYLKSRASLRTLTDGSVDD